MKLHTQILTTAAALAPPNLAVSHLVKMVLVGSGGSAGLPGEYTITGAAGINTGVAHFPAFPGLQTTAAVAATEYPQATVWWPHWFINATNVAAGNTVVTNLTREYLTYADVGSISPYTRELASWRAVSVTGSESGTGGTAKTYTFDLSPNKPKALLEVFGVATGTITGVPSASIQMPSVDSGVTQRVAALFTAAGAETKDLLDLAETVSDQYAPAPSEALTHFADGLGGATTLQVMGFLFY